jgi:hypothetical protein
LESEVRNGYPGRLVRLAAHPSLLLNIVAPVVAYQLLAGNGVDTVDALAASAVFPAAGGVLVMLRARRVDPLAVLSLAAIAIGLVVGLAFHEGRILLVKDSLTTAVLGMVFLCSLLAPKPMIFTLRRRLFVTDQRDALADYDRTWQSRAVRTEARRITVIWGVALLAEAALRISLSYLVSVGTLVAISPLLAPLTFGPLVVLTLRRRKPSQSQPEASDAPFLVS